MDYRDYKEEIKMTKKLLSGLVASLLIFGALIPNTTFADEVPTDGDQGGNIQTKEMRNPFAGEKTERTPEEKAELRLELVETYAPDQVDTYSALVVEHQNLHAAIDSAKEEIKEIRESKREEAKEDLKAYIEGLKSQIENEEITREEAAELFDTYTEELKENRESFKPDQDALDKIKADLEANKSARQTVRASLKEAIDSEDTDAAYQLILDLIELGAEHNVIDQVKLDLIEDLLSSLIE
tara:strand:+ start:303 stop:1022 length:720 start_codon:yes stop_codon:yes gene_type:complete